MPAPLLCLRPIIVIHANPLRGANGEMRVVDRIKQLLCYRTYNVVPGRFMAGYFPSPVTIRNPFDMALFHYEGQAKSKEVLFVGRLARIKGADVLIRAIAEIAPELPPFAVTIVGDGPEKENLQALAASLGQSQIIFAGSKQGAELAAIMRDHCILVVPSTYLEPSGLVTLEGLASGCLPIVSRRGGMRETIGPHGLDFENGDSLDLATKLKSVLIDPTIGERLMSGVENHLANHTAEAVAKTYLDLIAEILHEGPRD
jgi:glycosyltransferase involved in cell wall biosynthesis